MNLCRVCQAEVVTVSELQAVEKLFKETMPIQ